MDNLLEVVSPFVTLIVNIVLILLVFMFVVKPILNYFILNREIENRKKLALEYSEAKREAEAVRKESKEGDSSNWTSSSADSNENASGEQKSEPTIG